MAQITITLLNSKRARQQVNDLDVQTVIEAGGYSVVEGEDNCTSISVVYPEIYANYNKIVQMTNAAGFKTQTALTGSSVITFTIPRHMAVAGNMELVFRASSLDGTITSVWRPVIVPVTRSGLDPDAIASSETKGGSYYNSHLNYAEVAEWADGGSDDKEGFFVTSYAPSAQRQFPRITTATSSASAIGVTVASPAFTTGLSADKLNTDGSLKNAYSYVAIYGVVPVRDDGTCQPFGKCVPNDDGVATHSDKGGFEVFDRLGSNRILIFFRPNDDTLKHLQDEVDSLESVHMEDLEDFYHKTDVDTNFLKKTDASSTYATKSDMQSNYLKKADASSTYVTQQVFNEKVGIKLYYDAEGNICYDSEE